MPTSTDIVEIIKSLAGLDTATLVFLSCALLIGVIALAVWLKNKRDVAKQEAQERIDLENAKKARAAIHAGAFSGLQKAIDSLRDSIFKREDEGNRNTAALVKALGDVTSAVRDSHSELIVGMREGQRLLIQTIREGNEEQIRYLNILLNNSRGVINSADSVRLIEALFDGVISTEFIRIAARSIRKNNYKGAEWRVREIAVGAMTDVARKVEKSLLEYKFAIRADLFFPKDENGEYVIVAKVWAELEAVHQARYEVERKSASDSGYVDSVSARIRRIVTKTFEDGRERTLDIYYDGTPDTVSVVKEKMTTPSPRNSVHVQSN